MMTAREDFYAGDQWTDRRARRVLPLLIALAENGGETPYKDLDRLVVEQYGETPLPGFYQLYGQVLERVGRALISLGEEWATKIPPLTVLVYNADTGLPGSGVDFFVDHRYRGAGRSNLSDVNRAEAIASAIEAVHNYLGWDAVAEYFGVAIPYDVIPLHTTEPPIDLPNPQPIRGGVAEGAEHIRLKEYVAAHPELFADIGVFHPVKPEAWLLSGDEVDVLFENAQMQLAVEVKTEGAGPGEWTRGIYQCVKYRAVLRAMNRQKGEARSVRAILVTPMKLPPSHRKMADRLRILYRTVKPEDS